MSTSTLNRIQVSKPQAYNLQAAATSLRGATVNADYIQMIGDYQRSQGVFWDLIPPSNRAKATSEIIKEIRKSRYPRVTAADRNTLDSTQTGVESRNTQQSLVREFDADADGQVIKAIYGDVDATHFEQSLQRQQGYLYENTFAENVDDLFKSAIRYREQALFVGNATTNPLEFNGLTNLMWQPPTGTNINQTYLDLRPTSNTTRIHKQLVKVALRVANEPNLNHDISHIFTSGTGSWLLLDEISELNLYENRRDIIPGHSVPSIFVGGVKNGEVPLISSRYLPDELSVTDPDPDGAGDTVDLVHFYLVDMSTIWWYGVVPLNGEDHLDYQVFDLISQTINNPSLVERRFILQYGCLFAKNLGRGIHRVTVKLNPGEAYSYETEATTAP